MNEKSQTARRYDREFKENAVALVRGGRTITSVARDLGVTTWSLARWVQMAKVARSSANPRRSPPRARRRARCAACAKRSITCASKGTS